MSTISSISPSYSPIIGSQSSSTTSSNGTTATTGPKTLGQDEFLKLLAKQFQAQDPMKPMEDTSFIAQMAQFSSLQQSSAMAKDLAAMRNEQLRVTANSYLGHRVTVDAGNSQTVSGDVTGVEVTDGAPRLVIGDYTYPLSSVLLVEPGAVTSTPQATTTGQ